MYIVKYNNYTNDQMHDYDIFKIYDTAKGPGSFLLRADNSGDPVIISKTNQTITFLGSNARLNFSDFTTGSGEVIIKFFDVSFTKDTMWFAALTDKNNCVKGCRALKFNTTKTEQLSTQRPYESMRINGRELLGCKRNAETEELFFDVFAMD